MNKLEALTGPLYAEKGKLIKLMQVAYEEDNLCSYNLYEGLIMTVFECINKLEEAYK